MRTHSRSRLGRSASLLAVTLLLFGAAACGDTDDPEAGGDGGEDGGAETVTVNVDDNFFEPESVEVATGDTVTWEWVGAQPHDVSHDDFASDIQTEGTFEHTFDSAGTYEYVCNVHPGMEGTIEVTD